MQTPRIKFNEITNNRFPIAQGIRNRLGIIGNFSRGPANVFQYVNGFQEFAEIYGSNSELGSMGVQAAFDQGARNFGLIRVMGKDQNAKGRVIIGGTAATDNNLLVTVTGIEDTEPALDSNFSINITPSGSIYTGTNDGYYAFVINEVDGTDAYKAEVLWEFFTTSAAESKADAIEKLKANADKWNTAGKTAVDGIDFEEHAAGVTGEKRGLINVDTSIDGGSSKEITGTNGIKVTFGNSASTSVEFIANQAFTIKVTHFETSVAVNQGDQALEVAQKFENRLQGVFPFGTVSNTLDYVDQNGAPYTSAIEFELDGTDPDLEGTKGNSYYYTIALQTTPTPGEIDLTVSLPDASTPGASTAGFSGGVDGPENAKLTLYTGNSLRLIELVAASPGEWGNELRVTINYLGGNSFRINVVDAEADEYNPPIPDESFDINLTQAGAVDENGEIVVLKDSLLLRGYFLPAVYNPTGYNVNLLNQMPRRIAVENTSETDTKNPTHSLYTGPRALGGAAFDSDTGVIPITLEEGTNGPVVTEEDYVQAAKLFDGQQVHYIYAPGTYTNFPKLQAQLITVAENSTEDDGLKIAILNAAPKLKPSSAFRETLAVNSQRAVMVSGWATYAGQPGSGKFALSPDALYAGRMTTLAFYVSPAARTTSGTVNNVTEIDNTKYTSLSSLQFYTDARIEVIFPDQNLGGFFFLSGITTSSDPNWEKISVRRTYDVIRQDLYIGLQNYKSEPHTALLRKQLETSINAYMNNQLRNGRISNSLPAVANNSNNPQENYITGQLNVSLSFLPLYAADYINIDIKRNINGGLQIGNA